MTVFFLCDAGRSRKHDSRRAGEPGSNDDLGIAVTCTAWGMQAMGLASPDKLPRLIDGYHYAPPIIYAVAAVPLMSRKSVAVLTYGGRNYGSREIRIRSPRTVRIAPSASSRV
jgi:hypothetical protein